MTSKRVPAYPPQPYMPLEQPYLYVANVTPNLFPYQSPSKNVLKAVPRPRIVDTTSGIDPEG